MPTDEQRAFWAAIRANPLDDTARLVYADWLQENGDEPRAEFIRLQCALAKLGTDRRKGRKQRPALEARQADLLAAHREEWAGFVRHAYGAIAPPDVVTGWIRRKDFDRGFVAYLYLHFGTALNLVRSGVEPEPIRFLEIDHGPHNGPRPSAEVVAEVVSWEHGYCADALSLHGARDEDVFNFLRAGRLTKLWRLDFWAGDVTDDAVCALAESPLLASVKSCTLSANRITDAGAIALADSPHAANLNNLNLNSNPIGPAGRRRLRERFGKGVQIEAEPA